MQRATIINESEITITCIRHCKDSWRYERLLEGPLDEGLTKIGKQQAARIASFIKHTIPNDGRTNIVYSASKRAIETAQIIAKLTDIPSVKIDGLRGRYYGDYRLLVNTSEATYKDIPYQSLLSKTPPDAESLEDFEKRIYSSFCCMLEEYKQTKNLIMIIHQGIFEYLAKILMEQKDLYLLEGECCRFVNRQGKWSLEALNINPFDTNKIMPKPIILVHGMFSDNKQPSLPQKQFLKRSSSCRW